MTRESEWAIKVNNLSKQFSFSNSVPALSEISFQLKKGEILGLIGDNGAGKSTLLKIISGLVKPDIGTVSYQGKLSSILDIGSGFHQDLTGIDNIYLSGRIRGLSDKEIEQQLDNIIAFSELQDFIHTPVKYYSSGMFIRLSFTVATFFLNDILLLDEVMNVGDIHFQQKTRDRMEYIVGKGSTIIMAGHDIEYLSRVCTHGLWLSSGRQVTFGEINVVSDKYLAHAANNDVNADLLINHSKNYLSIAKTEFKSIQHYIAQKTKDTADPIILLEAGAKASNKSFEDELYMDDEIHIMIEYKKVITIPTILFIVVVDKFGHNLMSLSSHRLIDEAKFTDTSSAGIYKQTVSIPMGFFNHGFFSIGFYFVNAANQDIASFNKILFLKVHKSNYTFNNFNYKGDFPGNLLPFFDWNSEKLF